jgi:lipoprotein-anchoring transpeptidase ErfK/SrfK
MRPIPKALTQSLFLALGLALIAPAVAEARYLDPWTRQPLMVEPHERAQQRAQPRTRQQVQRQAQPRAQQRAHPVARSWALPWFQPRHRQQARLVTPPRAPQRAQPSAPQQVQPRVPRDWTIPPEFRRQEIAFAVDEEPGTIIIDTTAKFLYYVLPGERAVRYGIGVGREGFGWTGTTNVGRKAEWPTWTPPASMIKREPWLVKYAGGMPGGPNNPLGARAIYLHQDGRDTLYRIHGTNEPWTIGRAMSSGCFRMLNEDVIDLYERVRVGAKVIVR